jgi:DNA polymerase-3 subunit alpha
MTASFVHLRLHTEYSIEDSVIRIHSLVERAKTLKLPALALTDQMNVFGAVKFYRAMIQAGIKPILGVDAYLENPNSQHNPFRCVLLCQNRQGYHRLLQLISRAYLERSSTHLPVIKKAWLEENSEGLIALSGGLKGDIGQALIQNQTTEAARLLEHWKSLFPNRFYIEIQKMNQKDEAHYLQAACQLARHHHVPVVATHDIRFLKPDDFEAHETRVCIQSGYTLHDPNRPRQYTADQYLKSTEEMSVLFSDIESALKNTVEIAKRCNVELELGEVHLPKFSVPDDQTAETYLIQEAKKGLSERLNFIAAMRKEKFDELTHVTRYEERLQIELDVINKMGFASYFLIVADFIRWAKSQNIPVGPGRGSGAGSVVAYALKITDVDPLYYDLLFERFLNAERVSLPDFDIDFCMENRDRVIAYVMERYGAESVAQIITFGTMAARAVIRDVGRALGYPYGMVDSIAKLVPFEVGMTLDTALTRDEQSSYGLKARYDKEEEVKILIDLAKKLEGLVRNAGTHAGGVVIAPTYLTDFTALYYEPKSSHAITQLDKDDIESIGLVKFDFLGLRTLTIIDWAVSSINRKRMKHNQTLLDINTLPLDDQATFDLLRAGHVTAVFQLESRGIRTLLKRLEPDHFDDIVALIALFRPGPLQSGMVDDFINRKHDKSQIQYPHPLLEPILRPTYGVILYQEQVMQIAQVLAGYSLGSADLLRRAMGKKKPQEMVKQRTFFLEGAEKNGIDKNFANMMFDLIEKFAGYGFNKSHSVAYALLSYQTAWLKAHYPTEFMAAVLSSEMEHTEKLSGLIYDCRALNVKVNPPNIHRGQYAFTVNDQNEIEYGLGAIKGVGKGAIDNLLSKQQQNGAFTGLFDLCRQVDTDKVNRRALEALIHSGSLDCLGESRAVLRAQLDLAMRAAIQHANAQLEQQSDLFGSMKTIDFPTCNVNVKEWTPYERWVKERDSLGVYLQDHPIQYYAKELSDLKLTPLSKIYEGTPQKLTFAAWVVSFRVKSTAKGDRFVILLLEDEIARIELRLNNEVYQQCRECLVKDNLLVIEAELYRDKSMMEPRITVRHLWDIATLREKWAQHLMIRIEKEHAKETIAQLTTILKKAEQGICPIMIEYHTADASAHIQLSEKWKVKPTDTLLQNLSEHLNGKSWMVYQ